MENFVLVVESYTQQQIAASWRKLKSTLKSDTSPHLHRLQECLQENYLQAIITRYFFEEKKKHKDNG